MEISRIEDLRKITDVYIDLCGKSREFLTACIYFNNPQDNDDKKILYNWIFFRAVNYSFEIALIVELCKLFQKNNNTQKYNIHKFINVLHINYKSLKYKDRLSLETINKWIHKLNSEKSNGIIEYVVTLRNEIYAHTDNIDGYFQNQIKLEYDKIEYLLQIINDILVDIYFYVYECDLELGKNNFINFKSIVKIVLERNKYLRKYGHFDEKK